ncbi:hypothetical protein C8Q76DRAFT_17773 [Earliella scabrosa]|nr:hypothetical protein C8Q76DRAFT_17773 [Earliella scabrosa]
MKPVSPAFCVALAIVFLQFIGQVHSQMDLTACARSCVQQNLVRSSCDSITDPNCVCGEGKQVSSCVAANCTTSEQDAFSSLSASICDRLTPSSSRTLSVPPFSIPPATTTESASSAQTESSTSTTSVPSSSSSTSTSFPLSATSSTSNNGTSTADTSQPTNAGNGAMKLVACDSDVRVGMFLGVGLALISILGGGALNFL